MVKENCLSILLQLFIKECTTHNKTVDVLHDNYYASLLFSTKRLNKESVIASNRLNVD